MAGPHVPPHEHQGHHQVEAGGVRPAGRRAAGPGAPGSRPTDRPARRPAGGSGVARPGWTPAARRSVVVMTACVEVAAGTGPRSGRRRRDAQVSGATVTIAPPPPVADRPGTILKRSGQHGTCRSGRESIRPPRGWLEPSSATGRSGPGPAGPIGDALPFQLSRRGGVHERAEDEGSLGGRHPAHLHARARRDPGRLHPGHHGQPRRVRLGRRRGHLGQRVLRAQRLPHHHAAHEGVGAIGDHPAARLLGPPGPPPAARPVRPPRCHRALRSVVRARRHASRRCAATDWPRCSTSANWHEILTDQSYFQQVSAASPLLHTWTLAIEEQFYVVWPIVVVADPQGCPGRPGSCWWWPSSGCWPRPRRWRCSSTHGDRSQPPLLRDRHPGPGHPDRGGPGHPAVPPAGGRHRSGPGRFSRLAVVGRRGVRARVGPHQRFGRPHLPGRVPAGRRDGGAGHPAG